MTFDVNCIFKFLKWLDLTYLVKIFSLLLTHLEICRIRHNILLLIAYIKTNDDPIRFARRWRHASLAKDLRTKADDARISGKKKYD